MHILVEELKEILFHTQSDGIASEMKKICYKTKSCQKGGGVKSDDEIVKKTYDLSFFYHI